MPGQFHQPILVLAELLLELLRITGEHSTRIKVSFVPFLFFLAVSY